MSILLQALCLECEMVACDFVEQGGEVGFYPRRCAHTEQLDGHAAALIWNAWLDENEDQLAVIRERYNVRLVVPVGTRERSSTPPPEVESRLKIDPSGPGHTLTALPGGDLPSKVSSPRGDKWTRFPGNVHGGLPTRDKAPLRIEEGRCVSPAHGIRWLMYDGSLEPVRCGASNRCDYCAMLAAFESAAVLDLDARLRQPEVGITTTTARPDFPLELLRLAEKRLWAALRKGRRIGAIGRRKKDEPVYEAFPDLQYCGFLEWTTGQGTHSGGHRRPHIHHLVKGIPSDHPLLEEIWVDGPRAGEQVKTTRLEQRVSRLWELITGDAYIVEVRPLRTPAGAIAYLAFHHHKREQAAPPGFKGRRLRPSKGYYERPISELRQLARKLTANERVKRAIRDAIEVELEGRPADERYRADELVMRALCEALRDLADNPLELQLGLWPDEIHEEKRRELEHRGFAARMRAELEKIRAANPPELVQVRELQVVDQETGLTGRRVTAVLGPLEPRQKQKLLAARDRDFVEAVAA